MKVMLHEIFQAQHYGNVSPEEFMVPYPNLVELLTGQNIKHGKKVVFQKGNITNDLMIERSGELANWLVKSGIDPGDRVMVRDIEGPDAIYVMYGVWRTGACPVISEGEDNVPDVRFSLSRENLPDREELSRFRGPVSIPETLNLSYDALIVSDGTRAVRLSHYNLLVNTVGLQQILELDETSKYRSGATPLSLPWVILDVIMPFSSGATVSNDNDAVTIGLPGHDRSDYRIVTQWNSITSGEPSWIYFLPEAGGALCVGDRAVPMLKYRFEGEVLKFQGHSVMTGYTDENLNKAMFMNGWAHLNLRARFN